MWSDLYCNFILAPWHARVYDHLDLGGTIFGPISVSLLRKSLTKSIHISAWIFRFANFFFFFWRGCTVPPCLIWLCWHALLRVAVMHMVHLSCPGWEFQGHKTRTEAYSGQPALNRSHHNWQHGVSLQNQTFGMKGFLRWNCLTYYLPKELSIVIPLCKLVPLWKRKWTYLKNVIIRFEY